MPKTFRLRIYLFFLIGLAAALIGYKVYLQFAYADYVGMNARNIDSIILNAENDDDLRFAVIGSLNNSMRIFERLIAPSLTEQHVDYIISAGDAVYDGAESKYRLLFKGMNNVGLPFLMAVGNNEVEDSGASNFYHHFGPYMYSFALKDNFFIMLDSTENTPWPSQQQWLIDSLKSANSYKNRYVFMSVLPLDAQAETTYGYSRVEEFKALFSKYKVTDVFSASPSLYSDTLLNGVHYINVGQAGGLVLQKDSPYQYALVTTNNQEGSQPIAVNHNLSALQTKYETLKMYLHSFVYMSFFNVLVTLIVLSLLALNIWSRIIKQEHLYRDFDIDEEPIKKSLRIAMFTNNYLPFVGGVPISIERLRKRLVAIGHSVHIFAPNYNAVIPSEKQEFVSRIRTLFFVRAEKLPIPNLASKIPKKIFTEQSFDVVHVHHPFLLGWIGLRLASRKNIPVVFTYHTRLERYTHYLPIPGKAIKSLAVHFLIQHFANRCQAIITPTHSTEEYLRNLGVSTHIETIPTGIDADTYEKYDTQAIADLRSSFVKPNQKLLISVERLGEEKNLGFLLDGLKQVTDTSKVPFKCLIIGDGPQRQALEQQCNELGLSDIVLFQGRMPPDDVIQRYLAADLFVFSSTSETQGMVLIEAMTGGCPVVAVKASGVYDVIKQGCNGFTTSENTKAWAKQIVQVLEDEDLLNTLSDNSRDFAKDYSMENMADAVVDLYRLVISKQRAFGASAKKEVPPTSNSSKVQSDA